MTKRTKVGLIGTGKTGRCHVEKFAIRIPEAELVVVSDMFLEAAKKYAADYLTLTIYNNHHLILADTLFKTLPICLSSNTHTQSIKEPGSPNSISLPPFYCWEQEVTPAPSIT